jgi:prepilin-type N-terminal cleavage/methylation domain-containing protein
MKRSGFTMIELIFVIVILGILAAVAIPRLAATRDDAKISRVSADASTLVTDLGAYYTAQGGFGNWGVMSNVKVYSDTALTTDANETNTTAPVYIGDAGVACLSFERTVDGNLTVSEVGAGGAICDGVHTATKKLTTTVQTFGGHKVTY